VSRNLPSAAAHRCAAAGIDITAASVDDVTTAGLPVVAGGRFLFGSLNVLGFGLVGHDSPPYVMI
jgi:hypothetical protein